METAKCEFYVRFLLFCNERFEVEVWAHEFIPTSPLGRPGADWARDAIQNYSQEDIREYLDVPKEGDLQVLATGIVRGYGPDYNGEYDEDLEFSEVKHELMTEEFVAAWLGHQRENIPGPEPKNQLDRPINLLIDHLQRLPYGTTYKATDSQCYGGQTKCKDGTYLGTSYEIRVDIVEGIVPDAKTIS